MISVLWHPETSLAFAYGMAHVLWKNLECMVPSQLGTTGPSMRFLLLTERPPPTVVPPQLSLAMSDTHLEWSAVHLGQAGFHCQHVPRADPLLQPN